MPRATPTLLEGAVAAVVEQEFAHRVVGDRRGRASRRRRRRSAARRAPCPSARRSPDSRPTMPARSDDVGEAGRAVVAIEVRSSCPRSSPAARRRGPMPDEPDSPLPDRSRATSARSSRRTGRGRRRDRSRRRRRSCPGVGRAARRRRARDVFEVSVAEVAEQAVRPERREQQVDPSVAVVVAALRRPCRNALASSPDAGGDVVEAPSPRLR